MANGLDDVKSNDYHLVHMYTLPGSGEFWAKAKKNVDCLVSKFDKLQILYDEYSIC